LKTSEEETSFEINFALLKFKHTVKRKKWTKKRYEARTNTIRFRCVRVWILWVRNRRKEKKDWDLCLTNIYHCKMLKNRILLLFCYPHVFLRELFYY